MFGKALAQPTLSFETMSDRVRMSLLAAKLKPIKGELNSLNSKLICPTIITEKHLTLKP